MQSIGQALIDELSEITSLTPEIQKEFAEKYKCSKRTIRNTYKKALSLKRDSELSESDKSFLANAIKLPSNLQEKVSNLAFYRANIEDPEEGWRFWKIRGSVLQEGSAIFYAGIVYAESKQAAEELLEPLTGTGTQYTYIWHDCDFWLHDSPETKDPETGTLIFSAGERYHKGDLKKPHMHVMIKYGKLTTWIDNQKFVQKIFGIHTVMWVKVTNPHGMYDYFLHATPKARADHKYLYSRRERIDVNGFYIELNQYERNQILVGILDYLYQEMHDEYGRYEYYDLVDHFRQQADIVGVIRGSSNMLKGICDGLRSADSSRENGKMFQAYSAYQKQRAKLLKEAGIDPETGEIIGGIDDGTER